MTIDIEQEAKRYARIVIAPYRLDTKACTTCEPKQST